MMHGLTVTNLIVNGRVRVGIDRLGVDDGPADAAGGDTMEALHPYGFRSRPADPDVDEDGVPYRGAGLLQIERGSGDEGGIPTQDPRVPLGDEGKGGAQLYGWTGPGGKVSSVVAYGAGASLAAGTVRVRVEGPSGPTMITIDPATGDVTIAHGGGASVTVRAGVVEVGGAGGAAIARAPELVAWAAQVSACLAAVVAAGAAGTLGAPITLPTVGPLAGTVAATKGTVL